MKNTKILFIVCPPFWEKLPPLGIAYLSEFLKSKGLKTFVFDLNARFINLLPASFRKDWTINRDYINKSFFDYTWNNYQNLFNELLSQIALHSIDYVGFSVFNSNREFTLSAARLIKEKFPEIKIILGGPETFTMKQEGFKNLKGIDRLIIGEGEEAILSLLEGKNSQKFVEVRSNNFLEYFPKYESMDLGLYSRKGCLPVLMSRGCIHKCRFCLERLIYPVYQVKKAEFMFEEIIYYKNKGIRWFTFYDSIFNGNLIELNRFLDLILQKRLKIIWDAQIAVRKDMDVDLLMKMKKSGCVNLFIGLESGSSSLLKKMNKHFSAEEAGLFFQKLRQAGLQFEVSLIAHYPGETEKQFKETLSFLKGNIKFIPKIAQISLFRNYPGTNVPIPEDYNENDGLEKINRLLNFLKEQGIPYTKSYVNNLI